MLPIYDAIEFKEKVTQGGSTFPWNIILLVRGQPIPYIVKVFTKKQVEQGKSVSKEVYGNILAQQFDLLVPEACLVRFTEEFIESLPDEIKNDLQSKDERLKFAVRYIDSTQLYIPHKDSNTIKKEDKELIYAFDNFIFNVDRRKLKPNILVYNKSFALIDHELSLSVNSSIIEKFNENHWIYYYKRHLFYNSLKRSLNKDKMFITFEEYLKVFSVNILDSYANQLRMVGHEDGDIEIIKEYLALIKRHRVKFVNILRTTLIK